MRTDWEKTSSVPFTCSCRIPTSPVCPVDYPEHRGGSQIGTSGRQTSWAPCNEPWSSPNSKRKSSGVRSRSGSGRRGNRGTQWFSAPPTCPQCVGRLWKLGKRSAPACEETPSQPANLTFWQFYKFWFHYHSIITTKSLWLDHYVDHILVVNHFNHREFNSHWEQTFFHNDLS